MPTVTELRAKITEKGPWFEVQANARVDACRSCRTETYWIRTARGAPMLVDCDVVGGRRPDGVTVGRGVAHFATCPHSKLWSRK